MLQISRNGIGNNKQVRVNIDRAWCTAGIKYLTILQAASTVEAEEHVVHPVTLKPSETDQHIAGDDLEMLYLDEIDVSGLGDFNSSISIEKPEHWKPAGQNKIMVSNETSPWQSSFDQTPLQYSPRTPAFIVDGSVQNVFVSRPSHLQSGALQYFY
jgi:hypothetical protein